MSAAKSVMHREHIKTMGLILIALLVLATPTIAQAQFAYVTNSDGATLTITGYTGSGGAVTIPSNLNNLTVTAIGTNAFYFLTNVTGITFPNTITDIGAYAFYHCQGLTSVIIPASVTNLGSAAFFATNVSYVFFAGNLPTIPSWEAGAFSQYGTAIPAIVYYLPGTVWNLTSAESEIENPLVEVAYDFITNAVGTIEITGYLGTGGADVIPPYILGIPVTSIATDAFNQCTNLTSIAIPGSVTNIDAGAFNSCSNLTGVFFQGNAPNADPSAFVNCSQVSAYYSVDSAGWGSSLGGQSTVLWSSQGPAQYTYGGQEGNWVAITGYSGPGGALDLPFAINGLLVRSIDCTNLHGSAFSNATKVVIPPTFISIQNVYEGNSFQGALNLTNVSIPLSVTYIGSGAFGGCYYLTNITLPGNGYIDAAGYIHGVFNNSALTGGSVYGYFDSDITIAAGTTNIGSQEFANLQQLYSVTIPASVTNIGTGAFSLCEALSAVFCLGNAPAGSNVFSEENGKYPVAYYLPGTSGWGSTWCGIPTAPSPAHILLEYATNGGTLTVTNWLGTGPSITIPPSVSGLPVTGINNEVFYACFAPTNLTIPYTIPNIPSYAFLGCSGLRSISIPETVTNIGEGAFEQCYGLSSVTISGSGLIVGQDAFFQCTNLTNVSFGLGVASIGNAAFEFCDLLRTVTIPSSVTNIASSAFFGPTNLTSVFFLGDAPVIGSSAFPTNTILYYLPGTTGWGTNIAGFPTMEWNPLIETSEPGFGVSNHQFGFTITGATNLPVVIEACDDLANAAWIPLENVALTNGFYIFSEPLQTNGSARYYRLDHP